MKKFRTHLIINLRDSKLINKLNFSDTNFRLELQPEPTNRYYENDNSRSQMFYVAGKDKMDNPDQPEFPQNELIISAPNEDVAENALSIIKGGILLAYPEPSTTLLNLYTSDTEEYETDFYKRFPHNFHKIENTAFGCQVLERIINNRDATYALEKYKVSLELFSFTPTSADPVYGQVFDHYDFKKKTHTRAAFAITTAFSVLEELNLEIRSSQKNPRFLNTETGEWNPKILKSILKRLDKIGIKEKDTFDWIFRGEKTKVEESLKPYFGIDSQWVKYGQHIRDKTLSYPEAIHNASYLRNFIAAHKFRELTEFISPYDVFNIQSLARKLILENLQLWQIMLGRHKTWANNG